MLKRSQIIAAVLLVLALLLFLGASPAIISCGQPQSASHQTQSKGSAKGNSCPSPDQIIFSTIIAHPSSFITAVSAVVTAGATFAIALFTVGLLRVGRGQIREAKRLTKIAKRQMKIAGAQSDILVIQKEIQRQQFLAEYRPRLKIRHVYVDDVGAIAKQPGMGFSHNAEITGTLIVVNAGSTKAKNVESRYRIFCSKDGLPAVAPYDEDFRSLLIRDQVLDIGESCTIPLKDKIFLTPPKHGADLVVRQFINENWELYVMGQIRYADEGGHERFMGFCRQWTSDGKFTVVNDPDYEYED